MGAISTIEIATDDNYWLISNGTNWVPPIGLSANDPGECMIVNTYETGGAPNDFITRIDGSVTRSVDEVYSPTAADPSTTLYINQLVANTDAKIAELAIYNRVLTSGEIASLESYFAERYGL